MKDIIPFVELSAAVEHFRFDHDVAGLERCDVDRSLPGDMALGLPDYPQVEITDVFLMSHGWQGDLSAAQRQYDAWLVTAVADEAAATPLGIGVHWPSLP